MPISGEQVLLTRMKATKQKRSDFGSKLYMTMLAMLAVVLVFVVTRSYSKTQALHGDPGSLVKKVMLGNLSTTRATITAPPPACFAVPHLELWAPEVVAAGVGDKGATDSAEECCLKCGNTIGCNVWVWCADPARCGKQCWLKRMPTEEGFKQLGIYSGLPNIPWSSGTIFKDFDIDMGSLPPLKKHADVIRLKTAHGGINIQLMPGWSQSSVDFVELVAAYPKLCTTKCAFYRAEPGFLLQGSMRAFIPPNNKTTPGPKIMEKGEIGWAGGFSGPDFFIYLGDQPAKHFGHDHTVWGKVADPESLAAVERIVRLPAKADSPGAMHMLEEHISFTPEVVS